MTWHRATRDDLPVAGLWALAAGGAVAILPFAPHLAQLLPPCPLHELTGIPCLTCGATRVALLLARGEAFEALALNPMAALGLGAGVLCGLLAPAWVGMRGPLLRLTPAPHWRLALAVALAANWAYLILRGV